MKGPWRWQGPRGGRRSLTGVIVAWSVLGSMRPARRVGTRWFEVHGGWCDFPGPRRVRPDSAPSFPRRRACIATGRCQTRAAVTIGYTCGLPRPRARRSIADMNTKSTSPKILVVDDDVKLRDLLSRYLTEQGFQVATLADGRDLDRKLQRDPPHLLVLDLMLPGEDGLAICRRLRGAGENVPIVMLTAKGEEVDRIVGLEMGADDYLPKPFNPRELVARIHAVLRRHGERIAPGVPATEGRVAFGPWTLDLAARTLERGDEQRPADDRRVRAGQGVRRASAAAAGARKADAAGARARSRRLRPRDRRPGVAAAQAGRARPRQSALHPDHLGLRLRVRAGRRPGRRRCAAAAERARRDAAAAVAVRAPRAAAAGRGRDRAGGDDPVLPAGPRGAARAPVRRHQDRPAADAARRARRRRCAGAAGDAGADRPAVRRAHHSRGRAAAGRPAGRFGTRVARARGAAARDAGRGNRPADRARSRAAVRPHRRGRRRLLGRLPAAAPAAGGGRPVARRDLERDAGAGAARRGVRLRALPRASAAGARRRRRARRPRRDAAAAARAGAVGNRPRQPRLQPDGRAADAGRARPCAAARRRVARPAHAARPDAARRRDGRPRRGAEGGDGRRHRGNGPDHRPVPRLRPRRSGDGVRICACPIRWSPPPSTATRGRAATFGSPRAAHRRCR